MLMMLNSPSISRDKLEKDISHFSSQNDIKYTMLYNFFDKCVCLSPLDLQQLFCTYMVCLLLFTVLDFLTWRKFTMSHPNSSSSPLWWSISSTSFSLSLSLSLTSLVCPWHFWGEKMMVNGGRKRRRKELSSFSLFTTKWNVGCPKTHKEQNCSPLLLE